jgi:ABC-type lipoprotein export system ATPase subunit
MIKLGHLERRYSPGKEKFFYVLRDINLDIAEGEFVSVMGPAGAGKSTLLQIPGDAQSRLEGRIFSGRNRSASFKAERARRVDVFGRDDFARRQRIGGKLSANHARNQGRPNRRVTRRMI